LGYELDATGRQLSAELGHADQWLLSASCRQLSEIIGAAVDDMAGRLLSIKTMGGL